jgi:hypothetical protein
MLAGMCAAAVVSAMFPGDLNVSTTLGSGVSIAQGVFMEMFLTSLLIITIFMLAAEKHKATFLAPIGIGLALFVAELVGVFYTGGSLNPTRSFGPCVVTRNFPGYHYIYWFGPLMGTLLAFGVYKIIKLVEYQTVNPGQDFDDHEVRSSLSIKQEGFTNLTRMLSSSRPPTLRQPKKSNAPTSPPSPPKKLSASPATPRTETRTKRTHLAVSTGHYLRHTTTHQTPETDSEVQVMSTAARNIITSTTTTNSSICLDRRNTHTMITGLRKSIVGRHGTIWRAMRSC